MNRPRALTAIVSILALVLMAMDGPVQPFSTGERQQISAVLTAAPSHGLPAAEPAVTDDQLRAAVLAYAGQQYGARARPHDVDSLWGITPPPAPSDASLDAARQAGRLSDWLADLAPGETGYRNLLRVRQTYAAYAAQGGWPPVPAGPTLRVNDQDSRVASLRRRLVAEGYGADLPPAPEAAPDLFDAVLAAEVLRFQLAHGLEPDAVAGRDTVAVLNVTAQQRLAQIDANLERWRWLPRPLPADRIEVDVAAATATAFQNDAPVLQMKIVVGDLQHRTPLFYSAVSSIVINPPWNVPESIARAEILPKAARDPGYLTRNNFRYVGGRLQQAPGPGSALGVLKFDFESPYGVYLHDTPGKAAFDQRVRTLSHGCMRLEKPQELAALLLGQDGWASERLAAAIASRVTQAVPLGRTTPLILVYRTVEGLGDGSAIFRPDAYGWDAKLTTALARADMAFAAAPRLDSECLAAP